MRTYSNDIKINEKKSGIYVLRHRDFEWLNDTKNSVTIKEPRVYTHHCDRMPHEKIASGYECQVTFMLKRKVRLLLIEVLFMKNLI